MGDKSPRKQNKGTKLSTKEKQARKKQKRAEERTSNAPVIPKGKGG